MKRFVISLAILSLPGPAFPCRRILGVAVIPEGKVVEKTENRLVFKTELSHAQALKFYQDALKGLEDIKFREWKEETYIEDDGSRPWHSITISKVQEKGTTVDHLKGQLDLDHRDAHSSIHRRLRGVADPFFGNDSLRRPHIPHRQRRNEAAPRPGVMPGLLIPLQRDVAVPSLRDGVPLALEHDQRLYQPRSACSPGI